MEILFLEPKFKDYMWGGTRLKHEFNKKTPYEITAESWEISTNKNGISTIINGKFKGIGLETLFQQKELRKSIFGNKCIDLDRFPLLIKYIDAKKDLSVQVHPDDEYARKYDNDSGKAELWYIIDCKKNAKLIYGLKENVKQEQLENIIRNGKIKEYLNYIDVERGDAIYVPEGTIHAILSGILICEIQQNCDLTYRIYDWDRVDKNGRSRELHIDKAINVINLKNKAKIIKTNREKNQKILNSQYFSVDKINIDGEYYSKSNPEKFFAINVIEGKGKIYLTENEYEIKKGDSFIIPAELGEYKICGNLSLLKSYI